MKKMFGFLRIRKEEKGLVIAFVLISLFLHACCIWCFSDSFLKESIENGGVFYSQFHVSGYDPITYAVVTHWGTTYQVFRHPLLAFFVYPLFLLNNGLIALTGYNLVQFLLAGVLLVCNVYSVLFLYRIFREIIGVLRKDAIILTFLFYGFAHIMVASIVPDHFTVSMFLLLMTLYISGICIKKGRAFKWWQSALLFYITAGVTLSNGCKVFLSGFFVNLRDFFRPKYLLLAVILPAALLWGTATWENYQFVVPKEKIRAEQKAQKAKEQAERVAQMTPDEKRRFEAKKKQREARLRRQAEKSGTPMEDHGFLKWTDITTSRWQSVYENLFGESLQFHQEFFLEDTLVHRPVFVTYRWIHSYIIEGVMLLLFAIGIWCGRKNRFLWLCLSCFAFDMLIHLILGFGINEVFIMAPHFMFVPPIATAYLLKILQTKWLRIGILLLTLYLFIYNGYLLTTFLLSPIHVVL